MRENNQAWKKIILYVYMVAITAVISYFASKIWRVELWPNERFTTVVIAVISFSLLLPALSLRVKSFNRIMIIYHVLVISGVLMMLIPYEFRPVMAIFMAMTLMLGLDMGLITVMSISVAMSFLYGAEQEYLYGTLLIGALSCFVADNIKNKIKFIISCIVFSFASFFINGIFQYYNLEQFGYKFAAVSMSSVIISLIIIINIYIFTKPKSVEPFIGDDAETVIAIKEKSLSLYYHSVEVAELSRKAASAIGCDAVLAYAGGLLHDIGKIRTTDNYVKSGLIIANEYGMPRELKSIMVEHDSKHRAPSFKESAIVMLADSVISSIEYLKASGKEVSEKKIIDNVFNVRLTTGALDSSTLSISELSAVKTVFGEYWNGGEV